MRIHTHSHTRNTNPCTFRTKNIKINFIIVIYIKQKKNTRHLVRIFIALGMFIFIIDFFSVFDFYCNRF